MEKMDKTTNKTKPNKPQANPHQNRNTHSQTNKANLRDLKAATGL